MIEGLADFTEFVNLVSVLFSFSLEGEAFLGKLSDLDFIVLIIEDLPLIFLEPDPKHLNLVR